MTEPKPTYNEESPRHMSEWYNQITDTYHLKYNNVTIEMGSDHPYREVEKNTVIRAARIAYLKAEHEGVELTPKSWLIGIGEEIENDRRESTRWEQRKVAAMERLNERQTN